MLLQKLCEYSQRLDDLAPLGYNKTDIRWFINLDIQGNFLGFITTSSGKKNDRGKAFLAPAVMKSVNIKASLLVGNGEYVLGIARDPEKAKQKPKYVQDVSDRFKAFKDEIQDCAVSTQNSQVMAILRFLTSVDLQTLTLPQDFDAGMNLTFQVDGVLPIDLPEIRSYWARLQDGEPSPDINTPSGQCLACGTGCVPTERFPIKFKVIAGGQSSGMTLVSANKDAFESYGLKASLIAPVCRDCAERSAKAYNALLEKEDSRLNLGPLVYLFWTRRETEFNIASLFSQPQPEEVKKLLQSAPRGKLYDALDAETFYATALSASGARVVVRDWLETSVGEVKNHLAGWFALQSLVDSWGDAVGAPYGLFPLCAGLVRDVRRDLPPNAPRILMKVALQGGPLPSWLLFQALKRNRAEQQITRPRAALIKMVLLSQENNLKEDTMVGLDEENLSTAYLCGRILAVLERIQMLAVSPKATLIDRFYGTASTAPAWVFPRLLKGAQAHLGKLRKEKPGAYFALQSRLEAVMEKLAGFPVVLQLLDQGWFSLGYYHQRAWDRSQAKANKELSLEEPDNKTDDQA
ncbi:MAG: type I-C CRISPR-associated protein Cas8c/Csd1 [Deltaproteobacteria bacterium]|nr:type I-C CRISPR-associated protein Cas8c/Csd1 [Deltaproteobacteria bacterium]